MKVIVENEFWSLFPEAQISVLVVKGLDNTVDESKDPYFKTLLDKGAKRAEDFISDENFTQNDVIQEWRQAFSKFKTKKGARSSIEALLKGGEPFFPLGAENDAPALPEEIIYYDDEGAVCRCLNWREAQRTMLTEETKDAVLVIEAINGEQAARAQSAMEELQDLVKDYFGVQGKLVHLTSESPEITL